MTVYYQILPIEVRRYLTVVVKIPEDSAVRGWFQFRSCQLEDIVHKIHETHPVIRVIRQSKLAFWKSFVSFFSRFLSHRCTPTLFLSLLSAYLSLGTYCPCSPNVCEGSTSSSLQVIALFFVCLAASNSCSYLTIILNCLQIHSFSNAKTSSPSGFLA